MQVNPSAVRLKTVVGEIVGQFSYHAKDKGIALTSESADDAMVTSDRELIMVILQNLVGNAVKYAQRGRVKVVVDKSCEGGRACRVSVIDEGPGIAPERLQQLFQPFARGETHGQSGNGLGLSIARQAADLIGAKLWAESKVDDGTAFHLDLPPEPPAGMEKNVTG